MADEEIKIKITGDTNDIDSKLTKTNEKVKEVEKSASSMGNTLKEGFKIAGGALAAFVGLVVKGISDYKASELALNELNNALVTQGIYTKSLSKDYQKQASELQKVTTYEDDAIISAQAKVQALIGEQKITKELTKAILNFASANKMDLASAATMVAKSIGTSTNALARNGIVVSQVGTQSEKTAQIIAQLNQRYAGSAEAAAQGTGSIEQLKNRLGDVSELIGKTAVPVVTFLTKEIGDFLTATEDGEKGVSSLSGALQMFSNVGIVVKNILVGIGEGIGGTLGTLAGAVSQLMEGQFKMAASTIASGASDLADQAKARIQTTNDEITKLNAEFAKQEEANKASDTVIDPGEAQAVINLKAINDEKLKLQADYDAINAQIKADNDAMASMSDEEKLTAIQAQIDKEAALDQQAKVNQLVREKDLVGAEKILRAQALKDIEASAKAQMAFDKAHSEAKIGLAANTADLLNTIGGDAAKAGFLLSKAVAAAQIIMSGSLALSAIPAQTALIPYPANLAAAAEMAGLVKASTAIGLAGVAASTIKGFANGGMVTGGISGIDSVPIMAQRNEIIAPARSFDEVIEGVARQRGYVKTDSVEAGIQKVDINLSMSNNLIDFIEAQVNQRRAIGVSSI
jgi:hypothetical protein